MKKISLISITLLLLIVASTRAQTIKLISGDLSKIKGEKYFNIVYDYSSMRVGKFEKEEDYISKKVKDYNDNNPGSGDKWKNAWIEDRKQQFEPKFELLINKYLNKQDVYIGPENKDAKYTILLRTTFTEPGFNVYVTKKPALIDVEMKFVESSNPSNVIATIVSKSNKGKTMGYGDMDTGIRITEAYAKCGKELGKFLMKKVWN
jgi:hypothetical protein